MNAQKEICFARNIDECGGEAESSAGQVPLIRMSVNGFAINETNAV